MFKKWNFSGWELKFNYNKLEEPSNTFPMDNIIKFKWKQTSQEYKILYSQILDELLRNLKIDDDALSCNNVKWTKHNNYIQQLFEVCIHQNL